MDPSEDFRSIFRECELLLVVDEWKGQRFQNDPAIFQARGFTDTGRSTQALYDLLVKHGAADWHARGNRGESAFLFDCPAFPEIVAELDVADTRLYSYLDRDLNHYRKEGPAAANWRRIMKENPELAQVWDVEARHARSLFWFIELLLRYLQLHLGREIRVRVVVDQQDWLRSRETRLPEFEPGLGWIGARDDSMQAEILAITDKTKPLVRRYLPLLGLVDSEVWAFGRLLSLTMKDGTRVHERYMARSAAGAIHAEDVVISREDWEEMFERHHGPHKDLKTYWITLSNWPESKNLSLSSALAEIDQSDHD